MGNRLGWGEKQSFWYKFVSVQVVSIRPQALTPVCDFVMTCFTCIRVTVSWNNFLLNLPAWDLSFYLRRRSEYLPDIILTSFFPRNNFRASSRIYCLSTSVSAAVVACHCKANRKIRRYNDRTSLLNIGSTSFAFYKLWSWRKSLNIILLVKTNNMLHVSLHQLDPKLVIYRARAWHYPIFPDFFKMADMSE